MTRWAVRAPARGLGSSNILRCYNQGYHSNSDRGLIGTVPCLPYSTVYWSSDGRSAREKSLEKSGTGGFAAIKKKNSQKTGIGLTDDD